MDGVLLAGGLASRLDPITRVTNKHLLPVYNKPMLFYGIETLRDLGCKRIIIILGGNSVGDIVNLVRDGKQFDVEIIYKFQHEPKGISHAILLSKDVIKSGRFLVLLGDNIFSNGESLKNSIWKWKSDNKDAIFLHESDRPYDYGQPLFDTNGHITWFVEKSRTVGHNKIVVGLYGFSRSVFDIIERQEFSARGELEITDTLNHCVTQYFNYEGFWSDCGTPEGLVEASNYMRDRYGRNNKNS